MGIRYYIIIASLTTLFLASCARVNTRFSRPPYEGKQLLYSQKIEGNKNLSTYDLEEYLKQNPNRKLVFHWIMPYLAAYFKGEDQYLKPQFKDKKAKKKSKISSKYDAKLSETDSTSRKYNRLIDRKNKKILKINQMIKEGNWLMTSVGEKPELYDSSLTAYTAEQLQKYILSKGYRQSKVETIIKERRKGKKVEVTFKITEGQPTIFRNIVYKISDPKIAEVIAQSRENSRIKTGANYNESKISAERERITRALRNNGYFKFQRQYIFFVIDNVDNPYIADVEIEIQNPSTTTLHQQYEVTKVKCIVDGKNEFLLDTLYNGIEYQLGDPKFSLKVLNDFVRVRPNKLYSLQNTETTQNSMGNTDIFKFVNINYQETDSLKLTAYINANSYNKYQITSEGGMTYNVSQGQSIPGPFVNVRFKDRKVFNGFEVFEANALYSVQGQVGFIQNDTLDQLVQSREFGINSALVFPKILFPQSLTPQKWQDFLRESRPESRIVIGYSGAKRFEYDRRIFITSLNYKFLPDSRQMFTFSPVEMSIINTVDIHPLFQEYLDDLKSNNGINLAQSFRRSIVSNASFSYTFNNNDLTKNKPATYLKVSSEFGGLAARFLDNIGNGDTVLFGLPYYQYGRITLDLRKYIPYSRYGSVIFRLNTGLGKAYGVSEVLPYEKFLFAGGINSIRAWSPRRLGPGGYIADEDAAKGADQPLDYRFEQPGELLLESSLELRGKIVGFVNGALFVDAGNVWLLQQDDSKEDAEVGPTFWRQIGVGAGAGLRLDFSFLVFRLDAAWKIYEPAREQFIQQFRVKDALLNIGIGYPF